VIETQTTGAHAFIDTLKANGIDTIFGLPGSTEAPLLEALRADAEMRYVLTLQETVTVAMADGYARAGRRVGVVGLHTTVGTMNGLSQVYNAARDNSPVVVTAGHKDTGVLAADGFCALPDLPSLSRSFVKHAWQSMTSGAVGSDVRRAINVAAANPPGPTYLSIPEDIQAGPAAAVDIAEQRAFAATANAHLQRRPDAEAVAAAVRLLLEARKPILVLGASAAAFANEARALAEALELPVFAIERTQLSELPYAVSDSRYVGQYGEQRPLIADCDCVAVIGARAFFPFSTESAAKLPDGAKLIHASSDSAQIGWQIVPDVGLAGDAGAVLADLTAAVAAAGGLPAQRRADRITRMKDLRNQYRAANLADRTRHDELAAEAHAVSLVALTDALGAVLPPNALIFDEAISSSRALLRHTAFSEGTRVFRTNGGSLGWGLPAAVGAKIACPDRAVVCVVGDGTFHFTPQALWTSARENAPVVTIVVDNSGYLAVKLSIERHLGVAKDEQLHPGTQLPALDHVAVARGYGAHAMRIDDPAKLQPALAEALASDRSTVIVVPVANARR
jgi:benzoylformate decarboxylase